MDNTVKLCEHSSAFLYRMIRFLPCRGRQHTKEHNDVVFRQGCPEPTSRERLGERERDRLALYGRGPRGRRRARGKRQGHTCNSGMLLPITTPMLSAAQF